MNDTPRTYAMVSLVKGPNPWSPHDHLAAPIERVKELERKLSAALEQSKIDSAVVGKAMSEQLRLTAECSKLNAYLAAAERERDEAEIECEKAKVELAAAREALRELGNGIGVGRWKKCRGDALKEICDRVDYARAAFDRKETL